MSAVVLAVLVLVWAAVLIPMWLRRHENANEVVSTARFAGAMRTLGRQRRQGARPANAPAPQTRKEARHGRDRWMVMPSRPAHVREPVVSARVPVSEPGFVQRLLARRPERRRRPEVERVERPVGYAQGRAARVAARRRLAILLLTSLVVSVALAVRSGGPWIAVQAGVDVLFIGGLAQLRHGVLMEQRRADAAHRAVLRRADAAEAQRVAAAAPARRTPVHRPAPVARPAVAVPRPAEAARAVEALAPAVGSVTVGRLSRPATSAPLEVAPVAAEPAVVVRGAVAAQVSRARTAAPRTPAPRTAAAAPAGVASARVAAPAPAGAVPQAGAVGSAGPAGSAGAAGKAPAGRRTVDLTQPGRWSELQAAGRAEHWAPARLLEDDVEDTAVVDGDEEYEARLVDGMDAFDAIFRKAANG